MKKSLNTSALVTADSPRGQRAIETFRAKFNQAGLDEDGAQRLNEHPDFAAYLLAGISRFGSLAPDYELARTILGKDFISPEDVMASRKNVVYTADQIARFGDTVPAQELLEWCRDNGHMLVAGPNRPLSLLQVRDLKRDYFSLKEVNWYEEKKFAENDKVNTQWIMLRKKPVPESTSKNWNEQQALLSDIEVTLNVAEVVWCVTTYKAVRNTYLLPKVNVRTSSLDSNDYHVGVGLFGAEGLGVGYSWDLARVGSLGVSAGWKFWTLTT